MEAIASVVAETADAARRRLESIAGRLPGGSRAETFYSGVAALRQGLEIGDQPHEASGTGDASGISCVISARGSVLSREELIESYDKWGIDVASRLSGELAFILWDGPRRRLLLSRDRLGMIPLYFRRAGNGIECASAAASIAVGRLEPNLSALSRFLLWSHTETEDTLFRDVFPLPPGHFAVLECSAFRIERFWKLDSQTRSDEPRARRIETYRDAFFQSVCRRADSDDLGILVSGGIDSVAVACAAAAHRGNRPPPVILHMASTGLPSDESFHCRSLISHLGAESIFEDPRGYPDLIAPQPGPRFRHQHCFGPNGLWFVPLLRAAKARGIRRVLSGWGGDELTRWSGFVLEDFLRLRRWREAFEESGVADTPLEIAPWYRLARSALIARVPGPIRSFGRRIVGQRAYPHFPPWMMEEARALVSTGRHTLGVEDEGSSGWRWLASHFLSRPLYAYTASQSAMIELHEGVELSEPFFDVDLLETVASLCHDDEARGPEPKSLPRTALRNLLPATTIARRDFPDQDEMVRALLFRPHSKLIESLIETSRLADWGLIDRAGLRDYFVQVKRRGGASVVSMACFVAAEVWAQSQEVS